MKKLVFALRCYVRLCCSRTTSAVVGCDELRASCGNGFADEPLTPFFVCLGRHD